MTDRSLPTGDQVDGPAPRRPGPHMARHALGSMTAPEFVDAVIEMALRHDWYVYLCTPFDEAAPKTLLALVRERGMLALYAGTAQPSFVEQQWMARLARVDGVDTAVFLARDGLGPVEARLRRRPDGPTVRAWGGPL